MLEQKNGESFYGVLRETFPNAQLIGTTATPIRTDGQNIKNTLFNGVEIKPLYLADAILEDLLPNPCYIASLYAIDEYFQEQIDFVECSRRIGNEDKPLIVDEIKNSCLEYKKLYNIPNILQKYILLNATYKHNMKFVIFIRNVNELEETEQIAKSWFIDAFAHMDKKVNLYSVSYLNSRADNQKITNSFEKKHKDNVIDIMVSVNMFNEGIHLDEITGVILLRKTQSDTIYFQQIGRAIDSSGKTPIIFDFVNNYKHLADGYTSLFKNSENGAPNTTSKVKTKSGDIINIHDEGKEFIDLLADNIKKREYLSILENNINFIKEKLFKGYSCRQLAIEMDIPKYFVSLFVKQHFPEQYSQKRQHLSQQDIGFINTNYQKKTVNEMAEELDKTYAIIYNYCKNNDLDVKKSATGRRNTKIEENEEMLNYIKENMGKKSQKAIFTHLGITKDVFNRICKNNNIEKPELHWEKLHLPQEKIEYIQKWWIYKSVKDIAIDIDEKYNSVIYYIRIHPEIFSLDVKTSRKKEIDLKKQQKKEQKDILAQKKKQEKESKQQNVKKEKRKYISEEKEVERKKRIEILQSFNGELTIVELSKKTGYPKRSIQYLCERESIPFKRIFRRAPKALEKLTQTQKSNIATILSQFQGNLSKEEMSQETGYNIEIINFYIKNYNIPYNAEKEKIEKINKNILTDEDKVFIDNNAFILGIKDCAHRLNKPIKVVSPYWKKTKYEQTPHRQKISDETKLKILQLADDGKTYSEIARIVNCHYITIQGIVKASGRSRRTINIFEKMEQDIEFNKYIQDNKDNLSIMQLYCKFSYGRVSISKYLNQKGIILQNKNKKKIAKGNLPKHIEEELKDKIESLTLKQARIEYIRLHPNKTKKELSNDLQCAVSTISKLIKDNNLKCLIVDNTKKIKEEDIKDIKKTYIEGDEDYGANALSKQYGVCEETIRRVVREEEKKDINYTRKKIKKPWEKLPFGKKVYEEILPKYKDLIVLEYNKGTSKNRIRQLCDNMSQKTFSAIEKYLLSTNEIKNRELSQKKELNDEEIVECFKNGISVAMLAMKNNVSSETIKRRLIKNMSLEQYQDIQKKQQRERGYAVSQKYELCEEVIELILKLKMQGLSLRQIEKKTGVRHQKISDVLSQIGYIEGSKFNVCDEVYQLILQFFSNGKNFSEIGALTGINPARVKLIVDYQNDL